MEVIISILVIFYLPPLVRGAHSAILRQQRLYRS